MSLLSDKKIVECESVHERLKRIQMVLQLDMKPNQKQEVTISQTSNQPSGFGNCIILKLGNKTTGFHKAFLNGIPPGFKKRHEEKQFGMQTKQGSIWVKTSPSSFV